MLPKKDAMKVGVRVPCPEPGVDIDPGIAAATAERLGFNAPTPSANERTFCRPHEGRQLGLL